MDLFGTPDERQAARKPDEKHDWRKLVNDPELTEVTGVGGLSFYDAEGLRFHLPAYLSLAVKDSEDPQPQNVVAELLYTLTHIWEYNRERFAILNLAQRECIRAVLRYLRAVYNVPENRPFIREIDEALEGYWGAGICE
ncbi:MAG: DUF6714 family protein [Pirellulaceae bacterium]